MENQVRNSVTHKTRLPVSANFLKKLFATISYLKPSPVVPLHSPPHRCGMLIFFFRWKQYSTVSVYYTLGTQPEKSCRYVWDPRENRTIICACYTFDLVPYNYSTSMFSEINVWIWIYISYSRPCFWYLPLVTALPVSGTGTVCYPTYCMTNLLNHRPFQDPKDRTRARAGSNATHRCWARSGFRYYFCNI